MNEPSEFEHRVEVREGYIFVWQRGRATSLAHIEALKADANAGLEACGQPFAVFDNRETEAPDEGLRATMWTWLSTQVRRCAMLQKEVRNMKRTERRGERNRVTVQAFASEEEAVDWLLRARRG